jgi:hypothetical protein
MLGVDFVNVLPEILGLKEKQSKLDVCREGETPLTAPFVQEKICPRRVYLWDEPLAHNSINAGKKKINRLYTAQGTSLSPFRRSDPGHFHCVNCCLVAASYP